MFGREGPGERPRDQLRIEFERVNLLVRQRLMSSEYLHDAVFAQSIELKTRDEFDRCDLNKAPSAPPARASRQSVTLSALVCDELLGLRFGQQTRALEDLKDIVKVESVVLHLTMVAFSDDLWGSCPLAT